MKESDRIRFSKMLFKLATTFPKEVNDPMIDSYWDALSVYNIDDIAETCQALVKSNRFYPVPSEFIDILSVKTWKRNQEYKALPIPNMTDDQKLMKKYSRQLREETLKIFKKVKYRFVDRDVDLTLYKPDGSILYHAPDDRYPDKTVGVDKHTFRVAEKMDSSVKRWKAISNPIFRYEWFKKHTDIPDRLLNEIKNSPEYKEAVENLKKRS